MPKSNSTYYTFILLDPSFILLDPWALPYQNISECDENAICGITLCRNRNIYIYYIIDLNDGTKILVGYNNFFLYMNN
jgi:hypothetical protein